MAPNTLMQQGVELMLKQICSELQVVLGDFMCCGYNMFALLQSEIARCCLQGNTDEQLRALRTLANMSRRSASAVPVSAVQKGFRELGAFEPLTNLMWETMPDRSVRCPQAGCKHAKKLQHVILKSVQVTPMISNLAVADAPVSPAASSVTGQRRAIFNASLECCCELVTRCPENCLVAVRQGIIALVTSYISAHINPPPNPVALRLLYQLILCKDHASEVYEAMMCASKGTFSLLHRAALSL